MYGIGDFFEPDCTPGDPGCVPHWYCYIPGMATPDCIASFVQGTKELAGAAGGAVGGVVGSAAGGVVKGAAEGVLNPQGAGPPEFGSNWPLYAGLAAVAVLGLVFVVRR